MTKENSVAMQQLCQSSTGNDSVAGSLNIEGLKLSEIKYENHERRCRVCMDMFKARQKRIRITQIIDNLLKDVGLEVNN